MIIWLLQSTDAHPSLARGLPPEGLLSAGELRRFESLRTDKRRRDWLLGRWAAKRLVRSYVERRAGFLLAPSEIVVESDPDGAPRLVLDLIDRWQKARSFGEAPNSFVEMASSAPSFGFSLIEASNHNLQSLIATLRLSISHSHGLAFCAVSDEPEVEIGADLEKIEPRVAGFAASYCTPGELDQLRRVPPGEYDQALTLIWSAKEAALKTLRLGLTVDTLAVSCAIMAPAGPEAEWAPLAVSCNPTLLGRSAGDLAGWWRVIDSYALTLALAQPAGRAVATPLQIM